jgi:hypothetical protein
MPDQVRHDGKMAARASVRFICAISESVRHSADNNIVLRQYVR